MRAAARYLKHNVLSAVALFVALGGTGYAAISIPRNSIGTNQLRNGAVTPTKLAGRQIEGTIRAWAYVDANGRLLAAHGLRRGVARGENGQYGFGLSGPRVSKRCAATASIAATPTEGNTPGSAVALLSFLPPRVPPGVAVQTFNSAGQPTRLPFVVEVLC